jgi:hypothetical protein
MHYDSHTSAALLPVQALTEALLMARTAPSDKLAEMATFAADSYAEVCSAEQIQQATGQAVAGEEAFAERNRALASANRMSPEDVFMHRFHSLLRSADLKLPIWQ